MRCLLGASVAQLVEQLTLNQLVPGSSPSRGTIFYEKSPLIISNLGGVLGFFTKKTCNMIQVVQV